MASLPGESTAADDSRIRISSSGRLVTIRLRQYRKSPRKMRSPFGLAALTCRWRDLEHFVESRHALRHFHRPADAQRLHAFLVTLVTDLRGVGCIVDEALDRGRQQQDLVDADAPEVPGVAAFQAPHGTVDLLGAL